MDSWKDVMRSSEWGYRTRSIKGGALRVLVVDDSPFFRHQIVAALNRSNHIEVVGSAENGLEAVEQCQTTHPDVVVMDVEMPVMDGISAVRQIMQRCPTRILMFSSLTEAGAVATLQALEAGAVDFLPKKSLKLGQMQGRSQSDNVLAERVIDVASSALFLPSGTVSEAQLQPREYLPESGMHSIGYRLIAIGASTGGPLAIRQVIGDLPCDFPLPVVVAVHMPAGFTATFAQRLDSQCDIQVKEAAHGDELVPGRVLLAPGGKQLIFELDSNGTAVAKVVESGPSQIYKPSVDVLLGSAARLFPGSVLAVVMTGMGSDGRQGAEILKANRSTVWTQDEQSCVVYGMPQAVVQAGLSDEQLGLADIGPMLSRLVA